MTDHGAEVRRAELERCRAISEQDWEALNAVLADDLIYSHNGKVDDKPAYLENIRRHPRTVRRGELTIRLYGDIALVHGRQYLDVGQGEVETETFGAWHRNDDRWRLVECQSGRVES